MPVDAADLAASLHWDGIRAGQVSSPQDHKFGERGGAGSHFFAFGPSEIDAIQARQYEYTAACAGLIGRLYRVDPLLFLFPKGRGPARGFPVPIAARIAGRRRHRCHAWSRSFADAES
jgi:hypothetical protein